MNTDDTHAATLRKVTKDTVKLAREIVQTLPTEIEKGLIAILGKSVKKTAVYQCK